MNSSGFVGPVHWEAEGLNEAGGRVYVHLSGTKKRPELSKARQVLSRVLVEEGHPDVEFIVDGRPGITSDSFRKQGRYHAHNKATREA